MSVMSHPWAQDRLFLTLLLLLIRMRRVCPAGVCPHHPFHCWRFRKLTPEESDRSNSPDENRPKSHIPERELTGISHCFALF